MTTTQIPFVRALRDRALIGFIVTVICTSLGAAALLKPFPEIFVYWGAFSAAFLITLGFRFLATTKIIATRHQEKPKSYGILEISSTPNILGPVYVVFRTAFQVVLLSSWIVGAFLINKYLTTWFPLEGMTLISFRVLEAALNVSVLLAIYRLLWSSSEVRSTKTRDKGQ